jgi:hypothetical protein
MYQNTFYRVRSFCRNSCKVSNVTCWRLQKNATLTLSCYELNDSMN